MPARPDVPTRRTHLLSEELFDNGFGSGATHQRFLVSNRRVASDSNYGLSPGEIVLCTSETVPRCGMVLDPKLMPVPRSEPSRGEARPFECDFVPSAASAPGIADLSRLLQFFCPFEALLCALGRRKLCAIGWIRCVRGISGESEENKSDGVQRSATYPIYRHHNILSTHVSGAQRSGSAAARSAVRCTRPLAVIAVWLLGTLFLPISQHSHP
jgi:hypothetical protein